MPSGGGRRGGGRDRDGCYMTFGKSTESTEADSKIAMISGAELEYYNQCDHQRDKNSVESSPGVEQQSKEFDLFEPNTNRSYLCELWASDRDLASCGETDHLINSNNCKHNENKDNNRSDRSAYSRGAQLASDLGAIIGYYIEGAPSNNNARSNRNQLNMKQTLSDKYFNIRYFGVLFFIVASLFCFYKVYQLNGDDSPGYNPDKRLLTTHLKLVSVFSRHGDRAPSDSLPLNDKHADKTDFFWPDGMSNLTPLGRLREYRVGLELRRLYGKDTFLDYNASHFLAFSSPIQRCQDSINNTLRGLFDIEQTVTRGRKIIDRYNEYQNQTSESNKYCFNDADELVHNESYCSQKAAAAAPQHEKRNDANYKEFVLPSGSGSPSEYKNIDIDTSTVPSLTYEYLNSCKYRLDNPTPVDENMLNSPAVAQVKGVNKLVKLINNRYKMNFNFTALGLWSSISNEIGLARTKDTMAYCDHFADWIDLNVPEYTHAKVRLFDLFEYVAVLAYRDRITGVADIVQLGPILTSLIKSQSIALGYENIIYKSTSNATSSSQERKNLPERESMDRTKLVPSDSASPQTYAEPVKKTFADGDQYKDKKMIIYSTHDSILQLMMHRLGIIRMDPPSLDSRIKKWKHSDDVDQFLAGYRMSRFGASLVFELHESTLKMPDDGYKSVEQIEPPRLETKKFAFVQAAFYNQEDGKHKPVDYKRLKIGTICRRRFQEMHNKLPTPEVNSMLERFYDSDFPLDKKYSCPYELFKEITSNYIIDPEELNKLCV